MYLYNSSPFGAQAQALTKDIGRRTNLFVPPTIAHEASWATMSITSFIRSALTFQVSGRPSPVCLRFRTNAPPARTTKTNDECPDDGETSRHMCLPYRTTRTRTYRTTLPFNIVSIQVCEVMQMYINSILAHHV